MRSLFFFIVLCVLMVVWSIYGQTHFVPVSIFMTVVIMISVFGALLLTYGERRRR
jgi:Flp pilus assembly protein TadB